MQFVFYSEKTLLPHYYLHVMCHSKCSNRCLFCTFLNAFSGWESSYDSLYYLPFCHLECVFNYIYLSHFTSLLSNTFSLPEFCSIYVRLRTNSIQYILSTFMRFLFFELYFTIDPFQLVYWGGLTFSFCTDGI